MQRGEQQNERTKAALVQAFMQLVHEKSYAAITIEEISRRANVGRSTFYRHFASKADVLLGLHEGIFAQFIGFYTSAEQWLASEPSPAVVNFLQQIQAYERKTARTYTPVTRLSLAQFGNDIDYLVRRINELLACAFEQSLQQAFADQPGSIPLSILAQSLAGIYSWVLQGWLTGQSRMTIAEVAVYLQRLVRATLSEALLSTKGHEDTQR